MKRFTKYPSNYTKASVDTDIAKYKKALQAKASKRGLYENFGRDEIRKLNDKYRTLPDGDTDYRTAERNRNSIKEFEDWCGNYSCYGSTGCSSRVTASYDDDESYPKDVYEITFNGELWGDYDSYEFAVEELKTMINEALAIDGPDGVSFRDCYVTLVVDEGDDINVDNADTVYMASEDDDYTDYSRHERAGWD